MMRYMFFVALLLLPVTAHAESVVFDLLTIQMAADAGLDLLSNKTLEGTTPVQKAFLATMPELRSITARLHKGEAAAKASSDVNLINAFLAEHKIPVKLGATQGIAMAGVLTLGVEWPVEGVLVTEKGFDGFRLTEGIDFLKVEGEERPLLVLATKKGDKLLLIETKHPESQTALQEAAKRVATEGLARGLPHNGYAGAEIRNVKVEKNPNVDWLKGMLIGGQPVDQALQYVCFAMHRRGATAKAGTAMTSRGISQPKYYRVENPFMAVIVRDAKVIFAAYLDDDSYAHADDAENACK